MNLLTFSGRFASVALAVLMVDMTFPELNSDLGTATADGLRNVANVAANFACELYRNSPAAAIGIDPTGLGAFNNGMWSRLCAPRGAPPLPPSPPFAGGQCPELYDLNLSVTFGNADGTPGPTDTRAFTNIPGPLAGWVFRRPPGTVIGTEVAFVYNGGELSFGTQALGEGVPIVSVNSIVPVDGTDTCGNPPPAFPPVVPDPGDLSVDVNVDFGGLTIPVTVEFQPIVNLNINAFIPLISVNVGPINVTFSPGGVTFAPNFDLDINIVTSPAIDTRPSPPVPRLPPAADDCPDVDLTPVLDRLDDVDDQLDRIEECACEPEKEIRIDTFGPANNLNVTIPEGEILSVVLNAVSVGGRVRGQYGGGAAPDVEYLGWGAFGVGGSGGDRKPIHYLGTRLFAPPGATSFSYTLIDGSTASLAVEYEVVLDTP